MAENNPSPPEPDPKRSSSQAINNVIVVAFVLALLFAGVWLFNAISASQKAQECLESRRRNCAIIEAPRQ